MRVVIALYAAIFVVSSRKQYINVKGTLTCDGYTVENAQVELWEHDIFTPNDLLASTPTDILGAFELGGEDNELMDIQPFILIKHFCNAQPNCPRETKITVVSTPIKEEIQRLPDIDLTNLREGEDSSCYEKTTLP
ncbi:hypothetical protein PFISCL1PPCAC_28097 [Pristionchus fissidentatus]|uniref:Uncharacterized protein n=1 Tax=Pristionchus fissidentatus TaxID=1538716 RepID=A0AAV5WZA5_9BILA|nr:hypothetical protein PFISCL1PPCAC_28097 [Pristionchus fissidentatus]